MQAPVANAWVVAGTSQSVSQVPRSFSYKCADQPHQLVHHRPYHPRQPGRSVVFSLSQPLHPPSRRFLRPDAGPGAEDAELRDRSAPDVCPIAILRGLLL